MSTIRVGLSSLSFFEIVIGPAPEGDGDALGPTTADRTGESASATWANKATALICRRSSSRHV